VSDDGAAGGAAQPSRTGLYFQHRASHEHHPGALVAEHPDTVGRLEAIEAAMARADWLGWQRRDAPAATDRELGLVHSARQIQQVRDMAAAGGGVIDADTVVGEASYRAALHAAGGACEMARALMSGATQLGFCGVRPPGHHAEPDRSMGFCLFNNVAIAAALAISELGAKRVLILDWDVHHGNGTAEAFRRRSDVLYVSIHQERIYPGTGSLSDMGSGPGEGYTINLPVPAGSDEVVWLSLLEHIVIPVAEAYEPDLVLVSAGFDAHRADPLGGCRLEAGSFAQMARQLRDFADARDAPIGGVLEGGYEPEALGECVLETLAALSDQVPARSAAPEMLLTSRAAAYVGHHWSL
jgi:acetoin utilization deacetylase AcuC-like enzyme